jgi:nucleoid DNA-binding protein
MLAECKVAPLITRTQLIGRIAEECELTRRDAKIVLECVLDSIIRSLQRGDSVFIRKFGTFKTRVRSPRAARNPTTGARLNTPSKTIARFKPSKELLRLISGLVEEI